MGFGVSGEPLHEVRRHTLHVHARLPDGPPSAALGVLQGFAELFVGLIGVLGVSVLLKRGK